MFRAFAVALAVALAACAQIPPTEKELADKRMEPVADKAVVYIVQDPFGSYNAGLVLDEKLQIRTWPGTFYRWETAAGTHVIRSSEGNLSARITLRLAAGKLYFVQHSVSGIRGSTTDASLSLIGDSAGRRLVANGRACCD